MKVSLNKPASGFNLAAMNENFAKLEVEFQNKILYRNNPTGEPNTMENDLDMNGRRILNLPELSVGGVNISGLNSALVWRGAWSNSTAYAKSDAVSYNGSSYICTTPHTGSAPPSANWNVLAQAGLSGLGDVTGPASAVSGNIALFNGATGKIIRDSGITVATGGAVEQFLESATASDARTAIGALDAVSASAIMVSNRNRLINGEFMVDNRMNGNGVTTNNILVWPADRWGIRSPRLGFYYAQRRTLGTPPTDFNYYMRITSLGVNPATTGEAYVFGQSLELGNTFDWLWGTVNAKPVTLSFAVRASVTGTYSGAIRSRSTSRTCPFTFTVAAANTWEFKTIVIPGDVTPNSAWGSTALYNTLIAELVFDLGSDASLKGASGVWSNSNFVGVTGSVNLNATNNATLDFTAMQLEVGNIASPFERRSLPVEELLCSRYAQPIQSDGGWLGVTEGTLGTSPSTVHLRPIPLVSPMRYDIGGPTLWTDTGMPYGTFTWTAAFPSAGSSVALYIPRTGGYVTVGGTNAVNMISHGIKDSIITSVNFQLQSGSTFTGPTVGDRLHFLLRGAGHIVSTDAF